VAVWRPEQVNEKCLTHSEIEPATFRLVAQCLNLLHQRRRIFRHLPEWTVELSDEMSPPTSNYAKPFYQRLSSEW
jgi:hypothetical protein